MCPWLHWGTPASRLKWAPLYVNLPDQKCQKRSTHDLIVHVASQVLAMIEEGDFIGAVRLCVPQDTIAPFNDASIMPSSKSIQYHSLTSAFLLHLIMIPPCSQQRKWPDQSGLPPPPPPPPPPVVQHMVQMALDHNTSRTWTGLPSASWHWRLIAA